MIALSRRYAPLLIVALCAAAPATAVAQRARISEEIRTLATYPFSEPDPVPILARDARLYPYHSFEGYAATPEPRDWKVVKLENDYIEVYVLPEVGGKVWGAVVKETGHEFIYRNEVMKFRNIALRGPWTSGGIEFNFGVIGHTPATATPVDYLLRENADGSVSCFVGAMDLPSRTQWRVEIRLPAGKAYFETNVLWFNPTPLTQPYYNWMTAAAFARDDLEMFIPGDAYLEHSGQMRDWPTDAQGRYLPLYDNNRFDGSKSYHVVGELNDFFGGYYHDDDWGFGHWARYEDMPGQKLWLWALSRQGGIWEDLLTDTDGQYVEFQAGRLFVQYSPGTDVNPITQAGFDPLSADRWSETWFPLEGIGGLSDVSRDGALHAVHEGDELTVSVNAFAAVDDTLEILVRDQVVAAVPLRLQPLGRYRTTVRLPAGTAYRVRVPALDLDYDSDPAARRLSRPFETDAGVIEALPQPDRWVFEGRERLKERRYLDARMHFEAARMREPSNRGALLGLADLDYREARYEQGLALANRVLQLDAYDAAANFLAGLHYRALGRLADARDAFGWAARSRGYRSAGYVQLAETMILEEDLEEAGRYAGLALDHDRYSIPALRAAAVVARLSGRQDEARRVMNELLAIDPLHHFVRAEEYLASRSDAAADALAASLGGEYPLQSMLDLAIYHAEIGRVDDALALLELLQLSAGVRTSVEYASGATLMVRAWRAYLREEPSLLEDPGAPLFTFPFRRESLPVLAWARERSREWVWTYLHGLNAWAVEDAGAAKEALQSLGDSPEFAPFYIARAELSRTFERFDQQWPAIPDLRRAVALDPWTRTSHVYLLRHLLRRRQWDEALAAATEARGYFPEDFNLALLSVEALLGLDRATEAIEILDEVQVLPSENARTSHQLWQHAHVMAALDAFESGDLGAANDHLQAGLEWPEHLGQGRPYEPEERLVRYVQARLEETRGEIDSARGHYESVVAATGAVGNPAPLDLLLIGALANLRPSDLRQLIDADPVAAALAANIRASDTATWWVPFATAFRDEGPVGGREAIRSLPAGAPFGSIEGRLVLRALAAEAPAR